MVGRPVIMKYDSDLTVRQSFPKTWQHLRKGDIKLVFLRENQLRRDKKS